METRFKPPYDGLHAGEEIVWSAKKKASFFLICGLFLILFSIFFLISDFFSGFLYPLVSGLILLYDITVIFLFIRN